jgi:hypothetical protein
MGAEGAGVGAADEAVDSAAAIGAKVETATTAPPTLPMSSPPPLLRDLTLAQALEEIEVASRGRQVVLDLAKPLALVINPSESVK